ncbi:putative heat shock protein 70 HSP70 [Operophtera brumata]|uniref:Dynein axonemal assembly factor 4 n=1 Tax=Operophtera brumata TaxID=104452 RepID=A0A0L7LP28_OPEBR|nr:putative heat shock protein 70 HSP70 [Operophtera brumata]
MPILVKDFTWTQTDDTVHIRIPIKAVTREKVDLFTADSYIKAHYSPFLFEAFLLHDVDNDNSKCIVSDDLITLDLCKRETLQWECLEKELTKPEKMKLRQEILDKSVEIAQQKKEDRRIKKTQLDRFTVQQAMEIDTKQHDLMDSRKTEETRNAMNALEEWRVNAGEVKKINHRNGAMELYQSKENKNSGAKIIELDDNDPRIAELELKEKGSGAKVAEVPPGDCKDVKQVTEVLTKSVQVSRRPKKPAKVPIKSEYIDKKKDELSKRVLPRLRQGGQLEINHTPRTFPTPSRESSANEEQAWLKNITLARRATGFVSEDLRPEEQDPQWCKVKGDEFFRNGNYLGAVSAYSHGITLSDKLPSLYANRSATQFALGNFNKCGNRRSRAKCIARRAAALARCGFLHKGIDEMKAAAKLLPDDQMIKKDIYDMERAWEQNPDSE